MKHSLTARITIIFAISFVAICSLFLILSKMQEDRLFNKVKENQYNAINWLLSLYDKSNMPENWEEYFKNFDLAYVKDQRIKLNVISDGQILSRSDTQIGVIDTILYGDDLFLYIKNQGVSIMLHSTLEKSKDSILLIFALMLVLFISLYVSILKSLSPLRPLRDDMRKFASGNMDTICRVDIERGHDEISEVAYEFNNAACKIKELIMSRQLFLRTIMHELKTPIGKGRIVSEMVANKTQKERLISVFDRLNILIGEFAKIEQLLSRSYSLKYENYHFSLILEQVKDMLMLDNFDKKVIVDIKLDAILRVDFQLFCLAIKNLIDNALKYSSDKTATLVCDEFGICVKNPGAKLEYGIEHYKGAFVREKGLTKSGLGLGLYIIDTICALHKFNLKYDYKDGYHTFCVGFGKTDVKA